MANGSSPPTPPHVLKVMGFHCPAMHPVLPLIPVAQLIISLFPEIACQLTGRRTSHGRSTNFDPKSWFGLVGETSQSVRAVSALSFCA